MECVHEIQKNELYRSLPKKVGSSKAGKARATTDQVMFTLQKCLNKLAMQAIEV